MANYAKLVNGQLEYAGHTLVINEREVTAETFTLDQYLSAGYKEVIPANIQPPLTWFQDAVLNYTENDTQIIEGWEVVAKGNLRQFVNDYYNSICDNKILTGFIFKGMNMWLTAETQKNLSTDLLFSLVAPDQAVYPKIYNFDSTLLPINNLTELLELFNAAKAWIETCLAECWSNKLLTITTDVELYNELVSQGR